MEIKKNQSLGFLVIVPKQLKFRYEVTNKKKTIQKKKSIQKVKTEDKRGNLSAFLTVMTLPMPAETWLIKQPRLPLM